MDETGLFFNCLPDRTLALRGDKCHGGKKAMERLTVVLCCNADGSEKLKPLVIGKFAKPRCMKNVRMDQLPVVFCANKKAWMTGALFKDWLINLQRKMSCADRHILLTMDNCSSHIGSKELSTPNIEVLFFPPNTTSVVQPLDQGIIQNFKVFYRKRLVRSYLRQVKNGMIVSEIKKWSVLDAIRSIALSWNDVTAQTIANCFKKGGINFERQEEEVVEVEEVEQVLEVDDAILPEDIEGVWDFNFNDFVGVDEDLATSELFILPDNSEVTSVESNSDEDESVHVCPSQSEINCMLSTIDAYVSSHDVPQDIVMWLDKFSKFVHVNKAPQVQKKIGDYFNKSA